MTLLAVATSSLQGSLALAETPRASANAQLLTLLEQTVWEKKAMHSELATLRLTELLSSTHKTLKDLTHLAVITGPGSFTGIRVGVNLARTLAYGLGIPVATFNSLAVLAFKNLRDGERGLVAMKAVQQYFYTAIYEKSAQGMREILAPCSQSKAELDSHRAAAGKIWIEGESTGFSTHTEASDLVEWHNRHPASYFSWKDVKPLYIRASEAEEKLRQGLLKPLT